MKNVSPQWSSAWARLCLALLAIVLAAPLATALIRSPEASAQSAGESTDRGPKPGTIEWLHANSPAIPLDQSERTQSDQESASVASDASILAPPPESEFQKVTLTTNTVEPLELEVLPDLRVMWVERKGALKLWNPTNNSVTTLRQFTLWTGEEDGLMGLQLDPNFSTNNWIYLYYSPTSPSVNRLSRFTFTGTAITDEKIMLDVPVQRRRCCHTGGSIDFDTAGNLYLVTGDNTYSRDEGAYSGLDERVVGVNCPSGRVCDDYDAQRSSGNTNDLRGKLLRIKPTSTGGYTIPAGNLFAPGTANTRPEIYSMGHRNIYRVHVDKTTNWVYASEVGPDAGSDSPTRGPRAYEEVNQVRSPGNYGWPYCQANNKPYNDYNYATGQSGPLFNCGALVNNSPHNTGLQNLPPARGAWLYYDHGGGTSLPNSPSAFSGASSTGVYVFHHSQFAASNRKFPIYYDNKVFITDWSSGWIRAITMDASGNAISQERFLPSTSFYNPIELEFGPDGALYGIDYAGFFGGSANTKLFRIDYKGAQASLPVAVASANPSSGPVPLNVAFSSAGSGDPDGGAVTYAWDFDGNGTTDSTAANPSFTYTTKGNFTARLTVRKSTTGTTAVAQVAIVAGNTKPVVTINQPVNGGFYDWGNKIAFNVSVTDAEDGSTSSGIACSSVENTPGLGHETHKHNDPPIFACSGEFIVANATDPPQDNLYYVLDTTYTDRGSSPAGSLTGGAQVILQPKEKNAEYFTSQSGVTTAGTTDPTGGNLDVTSIGHGDWIAFTPMNLLNISSVSYRVGGSTLGGTIEVRAGSATGTLLSTASIPVNSSYADVSAPITNPGGTQTLYFVFKRNAGDTNLFRLNRINFVGAGVGTPGPPTPTPNPNTTNLALNKPATGSTACATTEGAAMAFDGSTTTKWCSLVAGTKQLQVDLGASFNVSRFIIKHAGAGGENVAWNTSAFDIQTSTDGSTWSTAVNVTANTASESTHTITTRSARHVRLNVVNGAQSGQTNTARIYELEVYGSGGGSTATPTRTNTASTPTGNLALNKPATGSTACATTEGAAMAFDGSTTTKWCSLVAGTKILTVDLGASNTVSSFTIKHAGAGGESTTYNTSAFNIQTSSDNATWTTVVNVSGNTLSTTTHPITARSARYVRLNVITGAQGTSANTARIYELEVYGSGGPTPTRTNTSTGPSNTPTRTNTGTLPSNTPTRTATSQSGSGNLALNKPATGSTACATTEGAAQAVDGSTTTKWCSLVAGTKILTVDLGSSFSVSNFVVKHAQAGGESATFNTSAFNIQTSTDNATWTTVVNVTGNTAGQTSHPITARSARYVRLNVITGAQGTSANTARIYELEVYSGSVPTPTPTATAGTGRIMLYDGTSATYQSQWRNSSTGGAPGWVIQADGSVQVAGNPADSCCGNSLLSVQTFRNFRLHVEFWLPTETGCAGEDCSNSGIFLQNRYEIQILNSFGRTTLTSGDLGGIYGRTVPSSNCAQAAQTWQSFDITFTAATWSGTTKTANARVTVVCNGITVQNNVQIAGSTGSGQPENANPGGVLLQNHGDPVRFRNVWVEPLP